MEKRKNMTASAKKSLALISGFLAAAALSGCAVVNPPKPRDTFELSVPAIGKKSVNRDAHILVKAPTALNGIDSDRFVRRKGLGVTWLANAQWTDSVPEMVLARLAERLENTGAFGAVARPGDGIRADYHLVSHIRRFELDDENSARLEMSVRILSEESGRVIARGIFKAKAKVSGSAGADYAKAFDAAFAKLSGKIAVWTLKKI